MDLGRLFNRTKASVENDTLLTLRQVEAFEKLKEGALRDLAERMHFRDYRAKEYLYHEEDPALGLYILQSGSVRLSKLDGDGDSYEIEIVNEAGMFGEDSLMGDLKRFETAQIMTDSRLLGFFKPDLEILLKRLPDLGAEVVLALASTLAERHDRLMRQVVSIEHGRELIELASNAD